MDLEFVRLIIQIITAIGAVAAAVAYFRLEVRIVRGEADTLREALRDHERRELVILDHLQNRVDDLNKKVAYLCGVIERLNGKATRATVKSTS